MAPRCLLLPAAVVFALVLPLRAQDVQVRVGDVKDSRTTGQFFANLEIELKLTGDDLADAKAQRITINSASDDTGRDLLEPEKHDRDFNEIGSYRGGSISLKLKNPARKAANVKEITGTVDLFVPKRDPASIVVVDGFLKTAGKPIESPALQAAKVQVTAFTKPEWEAEREKQKAEKEKKKKEKKEGIEALGDALGEAFSGLFSFGNIGENDLALQISDPEEKIVSVEFQDATGKKLERGGSSSSKSDKIQTKIYNMRSKVPDAAKLVIYLATPKAIVQVPVTLKDIPLP